ncbi:MAG: amylo-alpha-1,6-glucosidase [Rhizobiaceae bacterium]|nr:amylo-alpha-1,6-glucosidase [Rhizobiaceae bacterium]
MVVQPQAVDERHLDPAVALAALDDSSSREPHRQFALKHEDCFVVSDAHGDIRGAGDGMFVNDTRILSLMRLRISGSQPSLLGASLSQDNILFTAHLTNRGQTAHDAPHSVLHVERQRFLWFNRLYERVTVTNYWGRPLAATLQFEFAADFRDMFEVRGSTRARRGVAHQAVASGRAVSFRYDGLDSVARASVISFSEEPTTMSDGSAAFDLEVPPRQGHSLFIEVGEEFAQPSHERFRAAAARARFKMRSKRRGGAVLRSSGRVFNDWLVRARADIALLTTDLETGPYPYAGVPWFSTAFGRDGIISATQMLWLDPALASGVLNFLARHQATETASFLDAEPGKILHETRRGEMTTLSELPFGRYYGGVDTTPLYACLAAAYAERQGDMALVDSLWASLSAAMEWIEAVAARSPDGFVSYLRAGQTGLTNQGWKDSHDAVFHADGRLPPGPISLVEVQGYVFAAYRGMARLAERRGEEALRERWTERAEAMREAVERRFWLDDLGYYALAIDGRGEPCAVRASNAGHLLFVGLPSPERARIVTDHLLGANLYSGWGLRTLAEDQVGFNPMSYHNGSIWPHDTAICALGMARYGARDAVVKLTSSMFEAAVQFQMRLPELFCGFGRTAGDAPVAYPVACLPQAWSAGAPFMLIQACLGIEVDGWNRQILVERPRLPVGLDGITVGGLAVGDKVVDLHFRRIGDRVAAYLDRKHEGHVPLIVKS